MVKEEKILTPEEKERKDRLRFRLFVLLIIFDIALAGYLVYEMISVFTNNKSSNAVASAISIKQTIDLLKALL